MKFVKILSIFDTYCKVQMKIIWQKKVDLCGSKHKGGWDSIKLLF